ncbi:hypothetical protein CC79DRAFT_1366804 [Sarocladium strictum]
MASNTAVSPRPIILPPGSPTEFLSYVIAHCRFPSTVVICCPRQDFATALTNDTLPPQGPPDDPQKPETGEVPTQKHPLLRQTLVQIAVSRHIRIVFTSSVTHFSAWTSVFSPSDLRLPAPPVPESSDYPTLLVYGLIGLHRDTSEWSAQGLGSSIATLIDAAAQHRFRAVLMEPKIDKPPQDESEKDAEPGAESFEDEQLPLLKGIGMREDGTWAGRTIELRRVLGRWFELDQHDEVHGT